MQGVAQMSFTAYISTAYGMIRFQRFFFEKYRDLIMHSATHDYYGVDLLEPSVSTDGLSVDIPWWGEGWWIMADTLIWCLTDTDEGQKVAGLLAERQSVIPIDYEDYEPRHLYRASVSGELQPFFDDRKRLWMYRPVLASRRIPLQIEMDSSRAYRREFLDFLKHFQS